MAIHDGHRDRLRQRFLAESLDGFTDIQVLELLLFYCIPRRDTNPIAHELLNQFGTLAQVMDASVEELAKVKGMGEYAAAFLHLIPQAGKSYLLSRAANGKVLPTLESCVDVLQPFFCGEKSESVYMLCLDAQSRMLCCKKISQGDVNSAHLSIRKIVQIALDVNASCVLLAHNHPGGIAVPSYADIQATMDIAEVLKSVNVDFMDHVVLGGDDYVSLKQSGYIRKEKEE